MRHETILKKLIEIKEAKSGKEAKEKLDKLIRAMQICIEEKDKDKMDIRHLVGWYLKLWNNEPPEKLMSTKYESIIARHLKDLVKIYQQNSETVEQLKKDYENFKNTQKKGSKGITQFRALLPAIKKSVIKRSSMSEEYKKSKDEYELPSNLIFTSDEDEDVPF